MTTGGCEQKNFSKSEGRWKTVRKPGLDKNSGFEWKTYISSMVTEKEKLSWVFISDFEKNAFLRHPTSERLERLARDKRETREICSYGAMEHGIS